ncbi:MAG: FAD:protein FMN transferase [Planctomycetota bacterium]|jgi:thiamine biosynthesis lipoprotein
MRRRSLIVGLIAAVLLVIVLWSRPEPRYVTLTETIMAAPISVTAPAAVAEEAAGTVFSIFREVDAAMSEWKETSPLSALNRAAGVHPVAVPADLREVIKRAIEISERSDGAFDITWAALWGLWDFKAASPRVPAGDEIDRLQTLVDYHRIEVDDEAGAVYLPREGMLIGLGGIAKGHALDVSARALRERGIESFLISAAGQMMLGGLRGERPWRVGVRDPRGAPDDYFAFVEMSGVSISTSGDYERYFIQDGVRYHHILDPRTGRPSRGPRSVTVVSPDATLADALSTAIMILGTERGLKLAEQSTDVDVVIVDGSGGVHATEGLASRIRLRHPPAP